MLGSPREASRVTSGAASRRRSDARCSTPRSVAVVGASDDPAKWGHILARRALASRRRPTGALVNRRGGQVLGRPTYPSARPRPRRPRRAGRPGGACACPATASWPSVADAVAAGARAIVAITAGLSEAGAEGARAEAEAVRDRPRRPAPCWSGRTASASSTPATGLQLSHAVLPAGDVAVLSQSGNLVLDLAGAAAPTAAWACPGSSRSATRPTSTVVDLMRACVDHDGTRAVAVYAEDVVDGRAFARRRPGAARRRQAASCCWRRAAPRPPCAAPRRTPAR